MRRTRSDRGTVYLLHFDLPLSGRAQHYIGWTTDLEERMFRHQHGDGAVLMAELRDHGITFQLVRVWPSQTRTDERRLKRRHQAARLCPICRPTALARHAAAERSARRMRSRPERRSLSRISPGGQYP
jgi:predicted GIY-YIG superfamily endonuclease